MKTRVITSVVGFAVLLPLLIFSHTYAGAFLMQLLGILSVCELASATGLLKKWWMSAPLLLAALGLPLLIFFEGQREKFFEYGAIIFFIIAFYMLSVSVFSKGKIRLGDCAILFTMCFYTLISFNSIYLLRFEHEGKFLFILPFCVSWITDIFAYFSGRLLGKHKLIPDVSPKKTVEGAAGGLLFAVVFMVLYGLFVGLFTSAEPKYLPLIIAGILMSVASMAGDLIASLVKRHYGIKDYGKILPGHGGILDRFDSVLAAAPLLIILYDLPFGFQLFT